MLPPRWVRRVALAPAIPLATLLLLTSVPLMALVAAFASPLLPGRLRPLRLLAYLVTHLVLETATLLILLLYWIASGFGRLLTRPYWQTAHYRLMHLYLRVLVHATERIFNLRVDVEQDPGTAVPRDLGDTSRPLLVLSRHAGPGDSFLLVHGLLERNRRPRIVLRDSLQWAPTLDIALNRVPNVFVPSRGQRTTAALRIGQLARAMGPRDALVLFPEGRNFTPTRRLHSISRLEELGRHAQADAARSMRHVLTPRAGGALAALHACPDADVVFVGHTGLENLSSVVDLWRGLPMDSRVRVRVWRVDRALVPTDSAELVDWLLRWWRRIDAWIVSQHGPEEVPDAIVEAVAHAPVLPPEDLAPTSDEGTSAAEQAAPPSSPIPE